MCLNAFDVRSELIQLRNLNSLKTSFCEKARESEDHRDFLS